jgi:hypothetical protein
MRPAGTHETRRKAATRDLWLHPRVELANAVLFVHLEERPDEALFAICTFVPLSKQCVRQVWEPGIWRRHQRIKRVTHRCFRPLP